MDSNFEEELENQEGWWNDIKLRSSVITLLVFLACLIFSNFMFWTNNRDQCLSVVLMVFGACLGWIIGLIASPYTDREAKRFNAFASAAGTFASGYLLAKVDRLISDVLSPSFILTMEMGLRTMTLLTSMAVFFLITFIFRNYAPNTRLPTNITDHQ